MEYRVVPVRIGQDGAGTAVRTEQVDLEILDGGMFHLDAHVEDVVGTAQRGAGGKFGESDGGSVVEAVRRTVVAVGQEHRVADRQRGVLGVTDLLQYNVVAVGVADFGNEGLPFAHRGHRRNLIHRVFGHADAKIDRLGSRTMKRVCRRDGHLRTDAGGERVRHLVQSGAAEGDVRLQFPNEGAVGVGLRVAGGLLVRINPVHGQLHRFARTYIDVKVAIVGVQHRSV